MKKNNKLHGLYVITDYQLTQQHSLSLPEMVMAAIEGGARIVQYRDKQQSYPHRYEQAAQLCELCHKQGVLFIVNDDVKLAKYIDADGVHLGQTDATFTQTREMLGMDKLIGISCHDDLALALQAEQQGADYIALGRFFPSNTKPHATPATIKTLQVAASQLRIPIVAIGGITPENGGHLLRNGADMLAVIHGIFARPDITAAAKQYCSLFD